MQHRGLLGIILALSLLVIGATAGGAVAGLLAADPTGFDGVGDVAVGLFVGGGAGLLAALLLARGLPLPALRRLALVTVVVASALLLIGMVRIRRELDRAAAEAAHPAVPRPVTGAPVPPVD